MTEAARSSRAAVRNPVAADPEVASIIQGLADDHPAAAEALRACLGTLSKKWRQLAQHSWEVHKAPMAAYHKANAVNARHLALAIPRPARTARLNGAGPTAPRCAGHLGQATTNRATIKV